MDIIRKITYLILCFIFLFSAKDTFAAPFRFSSFADVKSGTDTLAAISNQIVALSSQPSFILFEGDLQESYDSGTISTWDDAFNGNTANGNLDKSFLVRGNHDDGGWENRYVMSNTVNTVGASNYSFMPGQDNLTYSFDYENAHFVGIDDLVFYEDITVEQTTWADQDITDAEARGITHTFLFFHSPLYYSGSHPSVPNANIVALINNHLSISAIFNGHEHVMAYYHLDSDHIPELTHSIEQFITGSAGANIYGCDDLRILVGDYCSSYAGFATIDVDGNSFTVSYYQEGISEPVQTFPVFTNSWNVPTPTLTPTPTSAPSNNNNNNQSSSSNNSGGPSCNDSYPTKAPDLFRISTVKGKATIVYTPVNDAITGYVAMYGLSKGDERYGVVIDPIHNNDGEQSYTINELNPRATYYFKVAAKNGCVSGPWSDWVPAKADRKKDVHKYRTLLINRIKTLVNQFK